MKGPKVIPPYVKARKYDFQVLRPTPKKKPKSKLAEMTTTINKTKKASKPRKKIDKLSIDPDPLFTNHNIKSQSDSDTEDEEPIETSTPKGGRGNAKKASNAVSELNESFTIKAAKAAPKQPKVSAAANKGKGTDTNSKPTSVKQTDSEHKSELLKAIERKYKFDRRAKHKEKRLQFLIHHLLKMHWITSMLNMKNLTSLNFLRLKSH